MFIKSKKLFTVRVGLLLLLLQPVSINGWILASRICFYFELLPIFACNFLISVSPPFWWSAWIFLIQLLSVLRICPVQLQVELFFLRHQQFLFVVQSIDLSFYLVVLFHTPVPSLFVSISFRMLSSTLTFPLHMWVLAGHTYQILYVQTVIHIAFENLPEFPELPCKTNSTFCSCGLVVQT